MLFLNFIEITSLLLQDILHVLAVTHFLILYIQSMFTSSVNKPFFICKISFCCEELNYSNITKCYNLKYKHIKYFVMVLKKAYVIPEMALTNFEFSSISMGVRLLI